MPQRGGPDQESPVSIQIRIPARQIFFCLPDFRGYAVEVSKPGVTVGEATRVLGGLLRDVMTQNAGLNNFARTLPLWSLSCATASASCVIGTR